MTSSTPSREMIGLLAATDFAERIFDRLREIDPAASKRLLDEMAQHFEDLLTKTADQGETPNRLIAHAELGLIRRVFDRYA